MKFFLILFFHLLIVTNLFSNSKTINFGVIFDNSNKELKETYSLLVNELKILTKGEFNLLFPKSKQIDTKASIQIIQKSLKSMQQDKQIDIILTLGVVSSQIAMKEKLTKPTFAPFVVDSNLFNISQMNESGIKNLNYLTIGINLKKEIENFLSVIKFSNLALIVSEREYYLFSKIIKQINQIAKDLNINLKFTVYKDGENPLQKLPKNIEAVMVGRLEDLKKKEKDKFINGLIEKKIPSYIFSNREMVENGFLMSSKSSDDIERRVRQIALNIQTVLRGEKAQKQPIVFEEKKELIINMATAKKIGLFPNFEILRNATLLNDEIEENLKTLTLLDVAKKAIKENLNIIAETINLKINQQNIKEVKSTLFPQIALDISHNELNSDNVYVKNGFYAQKSTLGKIEFKQILFSDKALANLEIQKELHFSLEARQKSLELEVIKQATVAFLNILIAQSNLKIENENLKLMKSNLNLAKNRIDSGVSDFSDVYHFESQISISQKKVLSAKANVQKTYNFLNRILHNPIRERFKTKPVTLDEPSLIISYKPLLNLITNEKVYELISDFFIQEALKLAPELKEINSNMKAQKRDILSKERSYYIPEIALGGEISHTFDEVRDKASGFSLKDETNWQIGVNLSLPIYEGGARDSKISSSKLKLQQLNIKQNELKELIKEKIYSDLDTLKASYPAIELSSKALNVAKKSFNLVKENYAKGTKAISELLIAQNSVISAKGEAINSIYKFMIDLMNLEKDSGRFDFLLNEVERSKIIKRVENLILKEEKR